MKSKSKMPLGFITLMFLGCTSGSIQTEKVKEDFDPNKATYVYGYAKIGHGTGFEMKFSKVSTKEKFVYSKDFAGNGIYKDHVFAFLLTDGLWTFESVNTPDDRGGYSDKVYGQTIGKTIEINPGVGNFLGKFDAQHEPLKDLSADSAQINAWKSEVDTIMMDRYKNFHIGKTVVIKLK